GSGVTRFALEVVGDAVGESVRDVPVEAIRSDVELAVLEPLRERRVRPVGHLGERLGPGAFSGAARPIGLGILCGLPVDRRVVHIRLCPEISARGIGGYLGRVALDRAVLSPFGHVATLPFVACAPPCARVASLKYILRGSKLTTS